MLGEFGGNHRSGPSLQFIIPLPFSVDIYDLWYAVSVEGSPHAWADIFAGANLVALLVIVFKGGRFAGTVEAFMKKISDNDLPHIEQSLTDLNKRVGNLERNFPDET